MNATTDRNRPESLRIPSETGNGCHETGSLDQVGLAETDSLHQDREKRGSLPEGVDFDVLVTTMQVAAPDPEGVHAGQADRLEHIGVAHATGLSEGHLATKCFGDRSSGHRDRGDAFGLRLRRTVERSMDRDSREVVFGQGTTEFIGRELRFDRLEFSGE